MGFNFLYARHPRSRASRGLNGGDPVMSASYGWLSFVDSVRVSFAALNTNGMTDGR